MGLRVSRHTFIRRLPPIVRTMPAQNRHKKHKIFLSFSSSKRYFSICLTWFHEVEVYAGLADLQYLLSLSAAVYVHVPATTPRSVYCSSLPISSKALSNVVAACTGSDAARAQTVHDALLLMPGSSTTSVKCLH